MVKSNTQGQCRAWSCRVTRESPWGCGAMPHLRSVLGWAGRGMAASASVWQEVRTGQSAGRAPGKPGHYHLPIAAFVARWQASPFPRESAPVAEGVPSPMRPDSWGTNSYPVVAFSKDLRAFRSWQARAPMAWVPQPSCSATAESTVCRAAPTCTAQNPVSSHSGDDRAWHGSRYGPSPPKARSKACMSSPFPVLPRNPGG